MQWFLRSLLIGVLTAYVGQHALAPGASAAAGVRITGTVAISGYALGTFQNTIWKGVPWRITAKFLVDGIVYGLVTAAVFAWLWPAAI